MSGKNEELRALREALEHTPDNIPLRLHLADRLLFHGEVDEAVSEFRAALQQEPRNDQILIGLARAYFRQGKDSEAMVIVEDLLKRGTAPAIRLLHARLLLKAGDRSQARRQYRSAVSEDPSLADEAMAEELAAGEAAGGGRDEGERVRVPSVEVPDGLDELFVERPEITFGDVGGMEAVKEEIRLKIIHPLSHPEIYQAYGKPIGGGILMFGPPGCGKTHLARATAGEVKAAFLSVGLNDVLDMWMGNSERNLHELFEQARRSRPCVLFFDEVDALGASRSDMRQSAGRQLINQFLSELDGVSANNEGVLILAATNAPWHLDSAFRRPGRFDRVIFVPPPDATARAEILAIQMEGKPADDIDFTRLGKRTDGFSGADLKALVDVAVEGKLKEAMEKGVPQPLTAKDLLRAAKGLKPTTKDWFGTARNYALYSNQSGLYDDILDYLKLR